MTIADLENNFEIQKANLIRETLTAFDGAMGATAKALGISRKALWENCRRYGIETKRARIAKIDPTTPTTT